METENNDIEEQTVEKKRINTSKSMSREKFFSNDGGSDTTFTTQNIAVACQIEDRYDYATTEDIVLLQERKDTAEVLYRIFEESGFADKYRNAEGVIRVPKADIIKVFYYTKEKLLNEKTLSTFEVVVAINEFYEFDYKYVFKDVLSSKMKKEILDDVYNNMGMKDRIDEECKYSLF